MNYAEGVGVVIILLDSVLGFPSRPALSVFGQVRRDLFDVGKDRCWRISDRQLDSALHVVALLQKVEVLLVVVQVSLENVSSIGKRSPRRDQLVATILGA